MDEKTLNTLEYPKVLERLAAYTAFSASSQLVHALRPTSDLPEALERLKLTSEARLLLSLSSEVTVGGATDVRPLVDRAARRGLLDPSELLAVKDTLISARTLARFFERREDTFPALFQIAQNFAPPVGVIDGISRAISDRGEILDSASEKLARIRREVKIAFDRLMVRLQRMVNDPKNAPILQEALITQRNGRYVIPLRAEFKGRIRSIVHDQSSSGATLFVEPLAVVEMNNEWHEQQLAEKEEERRILAELTDLVGGSAERITLMVAALAQLDMVLACAKYAEDLHAAEPVLVKYHAQVDPSVPHPGSTLRLRSARHPLLDPATVVPVDVELDERTFAVVITGPNTGGKTVTLKTVGLMVLMAQSGLHIPTQSGSELSLFRDVYADIGDEQSIEQSLSTFSGHIRNIVRVLRRADEHTLVLFDELGAGTDPQEGAALARAILARLVARRIPCLVATHYPELKVYAHNTPGVINASMEFDLRTLRPTYRLTIGLPGRSNALAIAARLGLDKDIIDDARSDIDPEELRAETLLNEIHHQRDLARRARGDADRLRYESEKLKSELTARLEKIEDERRTVLEKARAEADREAGALMREMDELRRQLARARQPLEALRPLQDKAEEIQRQAGAVVERQEVTENERRPLKPGERVRVRSIGMEGVVAALGENDVEVQVGNLRVRARLGDVQRPGEPEAEPVRAAPPPGRTSLTPGAQSGGRAVSSGVLYPSPGMEIDLRGQRAEDALEALDRYLESAYLAGLPFVRIIHGKGTGRLRTVLREALRASPHVKRFEQGQDKEGGEGVTVAHLNSEN